MQSVKKFSKNFIDFNKLSKKELEELSAKWEAEARTYEGKVYMPLLSTLKTAAIDDAHKRAGVLWKRVRLVEKWLLKNYR